MLASARKHNRDTHEKTHNKEESKRFRCSTCGKRFTRRHDRERHRQSKHGKQMPSSSSSSSLSVSSISKRRVDSISEQPDFSHRTTLNGDPTPTSPAYPDYDADIQVDDPENIIAWLLEV